MNTREQIFELEWAVREKLKEADAAIVDGDHRKCDECLLAASNLSKQLQESKRMSIPAVGLPIIAPLPSTLARPGEFFCERTNQIMAEPEGCHIIE